MKIQIISVLVLMLVVLLLGTSSSYAEETYSDIISKTHGINAAEDWENNDSIANDGKNHTTTHTLDHDSNGNFNGKTTICDSTGCNSYEAPLVK